MNSKVKLIQLLANSSIVSGKVIAEKLQVSDKAVSKWEKDDAFPKRKIAPHVMGLCTERVQARGITLANDLIKISCALYIGNFCLLLQRFSNMMEVQSGI